MRFFNDMDNRPIGMFDSGVGGLSVLYEVKKVLPNETYIFLADQANVPYGAKTKRQLKSLTKRITQFLLTYDIKMLVVACNTASCYTIDYLRQSFTIPIIGVVPAVKTATKISPRGKIAIMSTPATAKSAFLKELIKNVAPKNKILRLACTGLEEAVEYLNLTDIKDLITSYTLQVKNFGAQVIVLGCTHYPFLKKDIKKIVGKNIKVIDSGKAVASRVASIIQKEKISASKKSKDLYFTTGDPKIFSKVASTLLKYKISSQKANI